MNRTKKLVSDKCKKCEANVREVSPPSCFCEECRKQLAEEWRKKETWKGKKEFNRPGF